MNSNRKNRVSRLRKSIVTAIFVLPGLIGVFPVTAALLLEVDLSVENTISINATDSNSIISASGSDFTGFYLDGFFGTNSLGLIDDVLISGDLTSADEPSNLSPNLFHFSNDPGLNIFDTSTAGSLSFIEGTTAFVGSATWSIGSVFYQHFLANASGGDIFFPADSINDINTASILGSWAVIDSGLVEVPEPSAIAIFAFGLGILGFARARASN